MSIHSSLRERSSNKHRSVLKRYERLKALKEKNLWDEEKSVFGIPKVKMQKLKVKKEKAAAGEPATPAGAEKSAGTTTPVAAPAKAAAPAKNEKK